MKTGTAASWTLRSIATICAALLLLALFAPHPAAPPERVGSIVRDSLFSPALGVWKNVVVYLPASYATDSARRFPVAYYLHGLGGSENDWTAKAALDSTAAALAERGVPEMIIVMPDGDDSWYLNWISADSYETCKATRRAEDASTFCVIDARYTDYIARDVVAFIDSTFRTKAERGHRGIAGLSMGGYGALTVALQYPSVFAAAASHSGVVSPLLHGLDADGAPMYAAHIDSLFMRTPSFRQSFLKALGTDPASWHANDPASLARSLRDAKHALPALYLDCGVDDALIESSRALHRDLGTMGIPHEYHEYPGTHSWNYWRLHGSQSMAWIAAIIGRQD